jgi:hypothetical protein
MVSAIVPQRGMPITGRPVTRIAVLPEPVHTFYATNDAPMKTLSRSVIGLHKTVLLFLLLLLPLQQVLAAQIQVSVDRNPVSLNESFQIIFSTTESPDNDPDFSALEQDFDILSQSKNSKASWINGKSSRTLQWIVNVMAKQAGTLTIPAVKFGDDSSQAITVQVSETTVNNANQADAKLFLEVEATPEKPYIQSQVLYTLRLYRRVELAQASLTEPELADAVIEKLGDDSNFNTQINGMDYWVTERKYAIFPQKSGIMTINPLQLTAQVVTSNGPSFSGFFNPQMTKTQRVESKSVTLEVQSAPAAFSGQHWLAAEQLYLKEDWSGDRQKVKVGEPVTRTLTMLAKGTTISQLPELNTGKYDVQLKSYPDQPVLQEQKNADGVIAFREEKIALIPSKAGSYTLPAIEIPWFNTKTQQMEIAKIPETTMTAVSVAGTQTTLPTPPATATPRAHGAQKAQVTPLIQSQQNIWLGVSVFLALGWLTTVIYFLSKRSAKKPVINDNVTQTRLEDSVKQLKKACNDNDAHAAKNALIAWAQQKYIARDGGYAASQSGTGAAIARDGGYAAGQPGAGAANVINLGVIAAQSDARLRDEILLLNQVLYGKEANRWTGKKLYQAFVENKARAKTAVVENNRLEPLYRL